MQTQTIAGAIATGMFALSHMPMLIKAARTRSLASYSAGQLWTNCTANLVYWVYVSGLPFGPIWFMHSFHTVSMLLMLIWYLRYEVQVRRIVKGWMDSRIGAWQGWVEPELATTGPIDVARVVRSGVGDDSCTTTAPVRIGSPRTERFSVRGWRLD